MSKYAQDLSASYRRALLVEILSQATCRLAGISANSPESSKNSQNSAESSLTSLDVSGKTRLHVSDDNLLDNKEL